MLEAITTRSIPALAASSITSYVPASLSANTTGSATTSGVDAAARGITAAATSSAVATTRGTPAEPTTARSVRRPSCSGRFNDVDPIPRLRSSANTPVPIRPEDPVTRTCSGAEYKWAIALSPHAHRPAQPRTADGGGHAGSISVSRTPSAPRRAGGDRSGRRVRTVGHLMRVHDGGQQHHRILQCGQVMANLGNHHMLPAVAHPHPAVGEVEADVAGEHLERCLLGTVVFAEVLAAGHGGEGLPKGVVPASVHRPGRAAGTALPRSGAQLSSAVTQRHRLHDPSQAPSCTAEARGGAEQPQWRGTRTAQFGPWPRHHCVAPRCLNGRGAPCRPPAAPPP